MDKRLSLGINASIILILIIFCALLSLPLRLLFNTNYEGNDFSAERKSEPSMEKEERKKETVLPLEIKDFRKMKVCPFEYVNWIKSPFITNYDENCTNQRSVKVEPRLPVEEEKEEVIEEEKSVFEDTEQNGSEIVSTPITSKKEQAKGPAKINNHKSIPVAVHILAVMLVVSVIAALVEVLRIRFSRDKDASNSGGNVNSRRGSIINFMAQKKFMPREMLKSQRSLDLQAMHRSTRILGRPSLLRRSSFPTQFSTKVIQTGNGSPIMNRSSRHPSAESEDEISGLITALHHRPHLIRRH